jgi:hypothetical protein
VVEDGISRPIAEHLQRVGSPIPAEVFTNTERDMGCDAALLVAIAGADSSYGKKLKTQFNPGNVGNNDRGHRVGFDSWQEGVNAICQTLNNQYLGSLTKIGELSGGGRKVVGGDVNCKTSKCYATSKDNWNRNVISIMNTIKTENVDENYIFRR